MYALFEGMPDLSPVRELTVGIEVPPPAVPVEAGEELVTLNVGALTVPTTEGFSGSARETSAKPLFCRNSNCSLVKSSPEQPVETALAEGVHTVPCSSVQGEVVHAAEGG